MIPPPSRMAAFQSGPGRAVSKHGAFSLLETLIVMTILAMMALIVSQMVRSTTSTIKQAERRMDADAQARLVFNRMARDFEGMARRGDINFLLQSQSGNDAFYFFSEATGHFAESDPYGVGSTARNTLSLIGYRMNDKVSGGARVELERLGRGLHWFDYTAGSGDSTAVCYLPATIAVNFATPLADTYNNSSNLYPSSTATVPQWDVVGDQVARMEYCLLLKDGTFSVIPVISPYHTGAAAPLATDDSGSGYSIGSRWYDETHKVGYICKAATSGSAVWGPLGIQDISAVIVSLAVIDGGSRIVADQTALAKLTTLLPDFDPANPVLMSATWQSVISQTTFAKKAGLPASAASAVRIYQRYFYF
ncbi:MAG: type II secretion system protein J [Chthoniobacteraceae bacterium]